MIKKYIFLSMTVACLLTACQKQDNVYTQGEYELRDDPACEQDSVGEKTSCQTLVYDIKTNQPLTGTVRIWLNDGKTQWEQEYKDGKKDGYSRSYNDKGQLVAESQFINNLQIGKDVTYYDDGKLSSECNYENGQLEGYCRQYTNNGILTKEEFYKKGLREGLQTSYYDNGIILSEENYTADKLNGVRKYYAQNGVLVEEVSFKNGIVDGIVKDFSDENGSILQERTFKDGKAVSGYIYDGDNQKIPMTDAELQN